jgi:transcriptional regulator with XRE-family HTH domain
VNDQDPNRALAQRLRALREQHWPGKKVNQSQLAAALGGAGNRSVSVPLISSWESKTNPKVPPAARLQDIATFFASPRSFDGETCRLLSPDEMTVQEQAAREELLQELTRLHGEALNASARLRLRADVPITARSLDAGPYRFRDGEIITIVCARLPYEMVERMPYTDPLDPHYIDLYRYADLDALLELHGHMRAANPASRVRFQAPGQLGPDEYSGHLVSLGGVDWNEATSSVLGRLRLPVRQVSNWDKEGGSYFEVTDEDGRKIPHRPRLEESGGRTILREDVALFARAVSPFNHKRFITICNGMYGRGTYGAVRALTDERFRDRNAEYIKDRFASSEAFCILTRVTVENGVTLAPDWTLPETRLFEWSRPR